MIMRLKEEAEQEKGRAMMTKKTKTPNQRALAGRKGRNRKMASSYSCHDFTTEQRKWQTKREAIFHYGDV